MINNIKVTYWISYPLVLSIGINIWNKKPEILKRLARIEGHVRGIQRMVNEDKSYADIVQQISAVRAALDGVVEVMVQDLVEHYVSQTRDEKGKEVAIELKDTVSNIF